MILSIAWKKPYLGVVTMDDLKKFHNKLPKTRVIRVTGDLIYTSLFNRLIYFPERISKFTSGCNHPHYPDRDQ
jgi:hypothetical protein